MKDTGTGTTGWGLTVEWVVGREGENKGEKIGTNVIEHNKKIEEP